MSASSLIPITQNFYDDARRQSSASFSDADARAIRDAMESIRAKLPFLVTRTPKERRGLFKIDKKHFGYGKLN